METVIDLLEEFNIDYQTSGKNTTRGWVEVNCPFCPDPSRHLGINLSSYKFHCWQCGEKGSLERLLPRLLGIPFSQARQIVKNLSPEKYQERSKNPPVVNLKMPKGIEKDFPFAHRQYLKKRGFDPDELIQKYKLKACLALGGKWAYRIIIPIIINDEMVSYIGRDISGLAESKYINLSNEKSIVPVKDTVYNLDSVKKKVLILEGVTDVWRVGEGSVCLFGTDPKLPQLKIFHALELEEAYIMLDEGALKKAEKLANILTTFVPKVEILELDKGDPGELSNEEVQKIRKEIGL